MQKQNGQTIIETMVAVFILTMGIGAALGLASYSLNATTSIRQQIIAMGLAREGVEVVKHMRDTNWLRGSLSSCAYGPCYTNWLTSQFNISPSASKSYYLTLDPSPAQQLVWTLKESTGSSDQFELLLDKNLTEGLYRATNQKMSASRPQSFGRKITIAPDNSAPYNADTGPLLKVKVEVWWTGKKCPFTQVPPSNTSCKVVLETNLTNWKDYEL